MGTKIPKGAIAGAVSNPAGDWHNGAETKWQPNPFNAPELIYRAGIDNTETRHNSDTFIRPEFIDKNNIDKTKNYVVYDKNITTEQGDKVDAAIGN